MEKREEIIKASGLDPDGKIMWWSTFITITVCAGLLLFIGLLIVVNPARPILGLSLILPSLAGGLGIAWYLTRLRIVRKLFVALGVFSAGTGGDGGGGE